MLREIDIPAPERLSHKHKMLVDHYLTDAYFNKTLAGQLAGIKQPHIEARRILQKPLVKKYLDDRIEAEIASHQESMIDLSRMANGVMQYFLDPATGEVDLTSPQAIAHYNFIKTITQDKDTRYDESGKPTGTRTRTKIEVTDKLAARTLVAKIQGLLTNDTPSASLTINQTVNVNGDLLQQLQADGINPADVLAELDMLRSQFTALLPPPVDNPPPLDIIDVSPTDEPSTA